MFRWYFMFHILVLLDELFLILYDHKVHDKILGEYSTLVCEESLEKRIERC